MALCEVDSLDQNSQVSLSGHIDTADHSYDLTFYTCSYKENTQNVFSRKDLHLPQ